MIRCILRESWRDFKDSEFFDTFAAVGVCLVVLCGIAAIGYGLRELLTWLFGEKTVALGFAALVFLGCAVGFIKLLWRGIVAFKEVVAYCRSRRKHD